VPWCHVETPVARPGCFLLCRCLASEKGVAFGASTSLLRTTLCGTRQPAHRKCPRRTLIAWHLREWALCGDEESPFLACPDAPLPMLPRGWNFDLHNVGRGAGPRMGRWSGWDVPPPARHAHLSLVYSPKASSTRRIPPTAPTVFPTCSPHLCDRCWPRRFPTCSLPDAWPPSRMSFLAASV
jgi:hypothetical protein